ncbi:MAG: AAA family ATPase, partial [Spirochaetes bacterium]|nr:AAA family ATPase [Spirochaetota bacterium]
AGGLFIEGRCVSQENKSPYQPFRDAMNEYIRKFEKLDEVEKLREVKRIKKVVGDLGEIIIRLNPNMREILGEVPALVQLDTERENQRFLMAVSNFFCNITEEGRICILFLDDLQWADEGSLRLFKEIAVAINKTNLIIVGTYRSNEVDDEHSLTRIKKEAKEQKKYPLEEILLQKFNHIKLNKMVAGILGEKEEYAYQLTDYVLKKSAGNPFFAITILRELVEQKTLVWKAGRWEEDWNKINRVKILGNIVDMVLLRIKDLPNDIDRLLRIGATIGREFDIEMLYELMNEKEELIVSRVDEAENRQLIERSFSKKGKLLFIHDRIREAFFTRMGQEEQKDYHLRIGKVIEEKYKGRKEEVIFELAYHFTEAGNKEKALEYIIPAAEKAKESYANDEAIGYYKQAIVLLEEKGDKSSDEWVKANEGLTEVCLTAGMSDEAIGICKEILPLKESALEKARIYKKIGIAYFKKGDWEQCENNLAEGLALLGEKIPRSKTKVLFSLLKELIIHISHNLFPVVFNHKKGKVVKENDKEIIRTYIMLGWVFILSDINKFIYTALKMPNIAQSKIGVSKELGMSLGAYASLCMAIPLFKRAIKLHLISLELREKVNDEWGVAQSLQWLGYCYTWKGDYKKSIEIFEQARERFENMGDIWELGMVMNGLGWASHFFAKYEKTIRSFTKYLEISEKIKDDYGAGTAMAGLLNAYLELGDFDKAEEWGIKSLTLSEKKKIWYPNCFGKIHYGNLQLEKGNLSEAIKYLENAKRLYEENNFLKDYTVYLYPSLTDAYIEEYKENIEKGKFKKNSKELKKIKNMCKKSLFYTILWKNHYGQYLRVAGKYYALKEQKRKAKKYFIKSIQQTKLIGRKFELAKSYYEYGNFLQSINKPKQAIIQWQHAYNIFKEIGARIYIKRCAQFLSYKEEELATDTTSQERLSLDRRMTTVLNTGRYL